MKRKILGGLIVGVLCLVMLGTGTSILRLSMPVNVSAATTPGNATVSVHSSLSGVPEGTRSMFAVTVKVESGSLVGGMDGWLNFDSDLFEYAGKQGGLANVVEPVVGSGNSIYISYLDIDGVLADLEFDLAVLTFKLKSNAVQGNSGEFTYTSNECNASNSSDITAAVQSATINVIEEALEVDTGEDEIEIVDFGGLRYLRNIAPDELLEKVLNKFSNKDKIHVFTVENNPVTVTPSTIAATGMKFRLMASDNVTVLDELILVVVGDLGGSGTVLMEDVLLANNHRLEKTNPSSDPDVTLARTLTGIKLMAADIDENGVISTAEVIQINNYRLFKTGNPTFADRDSFAHLRLA